MASRSVNSGGSIKARKGNGFERAVAYNLQLHDFEVTRIDDNTAGVDLVAKIRDNTMYVECKHHKGFSWNQLAKFFWKTYKKANDNDVDALLVFKANNQPVCVMAIDGPTDGNGLMVTTWENHFVEPWKNVPKGYKVWKDNKV